MEALEGADMSRKDKDTILQLLDAGGARTALNLPHPNGSSSEEV